MPKDKKGVLKTTGKRTLPLSRELVARFRKETGISIKFKDFYDIVKLTNELMADAIINDDAGLKLPERLGHIVVTKYKSSREIRDWKNTEKLNKPVPILNLHSFGYVYHIKWFRTGCNFRNNFIYKFQPLRPITRAVSKNIKQGKVYHKWENTDFWSKTLMDRLYEKRFKTDDHN